MNKEECGNLIEEYIQWFRTGFSIRELAIVRGCVINTPFIDGHGDHLQVYVIRRDGKIILCDDGYVDFEIRTSGIDLDASPVHKEALETVLRGFRIQMNEGELEAEVTEDNFPQRFWAFTQTMLAAVQVGRP